MQLRTILRTLGHCPNIAFPFIPYTFSSASCLRPRLRLRLRSAIRHCEDSEGLLGVYLGKNVCKEASKAMQLAMIEVGVTFMII